MELRISTDFTLGEDLQETDVDRVVKPSSDCEINNTVPEADTSSKEHSFSSDDKPNIIDEPGRSQTDDQVKSFESDIDIPKDKGTEISQETIETSWKHPEDDCVETPDHEMSNVENDTMPLESVIVVSMDEPHSQDLDRPATVMEQINDDERATEPTSENPSNSHTSDSGDADDGNKEPTIEDGECEPEEKGSIKGVFDEKVTDENNVGIGMDNDVISVECEDQDELDKDVKEKNDGEVPNQDGDNKDVCGAKEDNGPIKDEDRCEKDDEATDVNKEKEETDIVKEVGDAENINKETEETDSVKNEGSLEDDSKVCADEGACDENQQADTVKPDENSGISFKDDQNDDQPELLLGSIAAVQTVSEQMQAAPEKVKKKKRKSKKHKHSHVNEIDDESTPPESHATAESDKTGDKQAGSMPEKPKRVKKKKKKTKKNKHDDPDEAINGAGNDIQETPDTLTKESVNGDSRPGSENNTSDSPETQI